MMQTTLNQIYEITHVGQFIIVVGGIVGAIFVMRSKLGDFESWKKEHEAETRLGYARLSATETLTARISALVEQHEGRLGRLERGVDYDGRD